MANAVATVAVAGISTASGDVRPPSGSGARRQGRYVLGELLGRGGMAEVFSGYVVGSHGFQKPVAIKRLLPELANDEVFVERLIGEAKLLVGMQHGNIVSVLDLARDGDDVFLVMEYVDGPSLRQLLKARGPRLLPLGVASYIVQSAAAGLEFAHARPGGAIVHADISPSNLLLTTSGEVRVADFGIARREGGLVGIVEGKWAYMAPEQARGDVLTPRSDVFALGVVLYELITGKHPFGQQISAEERDSAPIRVIPPRVVNPAIPAGLEAICMRALAENARDRYPRMQSMIDAIMDERFANQWRDGANDLANAIREMTPGTAAAAAGPRTQITDRPVTIITRSLISSSQRRTSAASLLAYESPAPARDARDVDSVEDTLEQTGDAAAHVGDSTKVITKPGARGSVPLIPPSGAQTLMFDAPRASAPMLPLPAPPPEPFHLSAALLPQPELASVHGGATVTASRMIDMPATGGNRWTFAVLGVAALIGIGAALAIQLTPSPELHVANAPVADDVPAAAPEPVAPPPVEVAAPAPTVPAVVESAPAPIAPTPAPAVIEDKVERPVAAKRAKTPAKRERSPVASGGEATLRVETYGGVWAYVEVAGQRGEIPDAKFKLTPGTYKVRLKNTDLAIQVRTCTVTLEAGQVRRLRVDLEEGACDPLR